MKKLLQELWRDLGWQGIGGVLVLLSGLAFSNSVLEPAEELAAQAREQVQLQRMELQEGEGAEPGVMLGRFYEFFSTGQELTDQLAKIYNLARANGLRLRKGDYKVAQSKGERMMQYQISFPLAGDYNQIRRFAAQVLNEMPAVALDRIRFERKNRGDPMIEAQIVFSLYRVQS